MHVRTSLEEASGSSGWNETVWAICKHLSDFQSIAAAAAKRVTVANGPSQVVYNQDGLSTPAFCALVIRMAWSVVRTRTLGHDNTEAHEFAEELFQATGGPVPEQDGREREWRQHFRAAARAKPCQVDLLSALFKLEAKTANGEERNKSPA